MKEMKEMKEMNEMKGPMVLPAMQVLLCRYREREMTCYAGPMVLPAMQDLDTRTLAFGFPFIVY
jgi:hypothetical protein